MAESNIQEVILIGRDQTCNFIVDDPSVSRNHAQIINYGTHVCVVDLGSTNGTFVNGIRVSSETSLHSGDELKVGNAIVPWEEIASPSEGGGGKGKKKSWIWILIVGIVLLLIGAAVAAYFLWIRDSLEKSKKENEELFEEVITGAKKTDSLLIVTQQAVDSAEANAKDRINKANQEAEKAEKEAKARVEAATKKEAAAKKKVEEANKKVEEADKKVEEADKKVEEADKKVEEADKKVEEADKKVEEANKKAEEADKKAELISQPTFMATLESMTDEEAESVCRELGIKFNLRKPAKEALKDEFLTSGDAMKQQIGKALTKYKKQ